MASPSHAPLLGLPLETSHRFDFFRIFFPLFLPLWAFLLGCSFAKNRRACVKIEMSPAHCRVWSFSISPCRLPSVPTAMSCFAFLLVCRWQSLTTLKLPDRERVGGGNGLGRGWQRKDRGTAALHESNVAWRSALSADSTQYKFLFANRLHWRICNGESRYFVLYLDYSGLLSKFKTQLWSKNLEIRTFNNRSKCIKFLEIISLKLKMYISLKEFSTCKSYRSI